MFWFDEALPNIRFSLESRAAGVSLIAMETGHGMSWLDWAVIAGYLLGTTWLGHVLGAKGNTIRDFFLAGRSLPWPAVAGSIVATSISAITFIGFPAMVYAEKGDLRFLQFSLASILARILVARYLIPFYYAQEIYSPYDFIRNRLGAFAGKVATLLFMVGSVTGQGVRVFATALVIQIVFDIDLAWSIALICAFAVLWTWMGGMAAVIWTDVVQFFVFLAGAFLAIFFICWQHFWDLPSALEAASEAGKMRLIDPTWTLSEPLVLAAALFAMPFQNLAAYGVDQLNAQRYFCCKSRGDASKAILLSCVSEIITAAMLAVGLLLYIHYMHSPVPAWAFHFLEQSKEAIFPIYILDQMPVGIRGLLLAAIFAAAISSLDSALAALAQTSTGWLQSSGWIADGHALKVSRAIVIVWGILLGLMAFACSYFGQQLVHLAFSLTGYTLGPMFGLLMLAVYGKKIGVKALLAGAFFSVGLVFLILQGNWFLFICAPKLIGLSWITSIMIDLNIRQLPDIAWPWIYPASCLTMFVLPLAITKIQTSFRS